MDVESHNTEIDDSSISRHHARLQYQDDGSYVLTDLQSSNGVYMLGRRMHRPLRIVHGDKIRFGTVECLLSEPAGLTPARKGFQKYILLGLLAATAAIFGSTMALYFLKT